MSSTSKQSTGTVPKTTKTEKKVEKTQERKSNAGQPGQHINVRTKQQIILKIAKHTVQFYKHCNIRY